MAIVTFSFEYAVGGKAGKKLNLAKKAYQKKIFWKEDKPRFSDSHQLLYVLKYQIIHFKNQLSA